MDLLRTRSIGRVGLSARSLPVVLPVRYVLWDDMVVLRAAPTTTMADSVIDAVVAFETDHFDETAGQGWSVMVQGQARELEGVRSLGPEAESVLGSWRGPGEARHVSIPMTVVSGRRLLPAVEGASR